MVRRRKQITFHTALGFVLSLVSVAGTNFIPLEMWLNEDFSGWEAVFVYWLANFVAIFLTVIFVLLFAPKWDQTDKARTRKDTLRFYLLLALTFSISAGVFFLFFALKSAGGIDLSSIGSAMTWVAGFLVLDFVADAIMLGRLTLFQAKLFLNRSLGRVFLFFLSVFMGCFLAMFGANWFVLPFVALKTLADIGSNYEMLTGYDDLDQKENPLTRNYGRRRRKRFGFA